MSLGEFNGVAALRFCFTLSRWTIFTDASLSQTGKLVYSFVQDKCLFSQREEKCLQTDHHAFI